MSNETNTTETGTTVRGGRPTAVLVHGAFADASGFTGVIGELTAAGYDVVAPPTPLRGVTSDAAGIHAVAAAIDGPVVLVGHSYGGAVISQAAVGLTNLVGLVYLAAFAPAIGESAGSVQEPFPPPQLLSALRASEYDAVGAAGGPELFIDPEQFVEVFAADVGPALAAAMAVSQRPLAAAAIGEPLTAAGWDTVPTWYLVSAQDHAIAPEAQRFMAERIGATTEEIDGSHAAFIARPTEAAAFIASALDALTE